MVADVLVERSLRCATDHGLEDLVMVGGVAANRRLRLMNAAQAEAFGVRVCRPAGLLHRQRRHDWCCGAASAVESGDGSVPADWGVAPLVS